MPAGQQPIRLQNAISVVDQWPGLGFFFPWSGGMKWLQEGFGARQHQAINIKTSPQPLLLSVRKQSALSSVFSLFLVQEVLRALLNVDIF